MNALHRTLTEGVEFIAVPTDKFKTSMLSVSFIVPLNPQTATAYALIGEVLNRGSRLHPDIESLSAATDDLYGMSLSTRVKQKGESQCLGFASSFLDDRFTLDGHSILEAAAKLIAEVLLDPLTENGVFCSEYVTSEGLNQADLIRSQVNDKRGWSIHRVTELMCEGEAYALDKYGVAEEAETMSAETLWTHYNELLETARIVFYYSGSASLERVERIIREVFAPIVAPRSVKTDCEIISSPKGDVRSHKERFDVTQGKLALGFRTGGITANSEDYPALMVCNALYGGTATSKLFMNVRERLSLCYFASSMLDKLKGLMVVSCGVDFSNFDVAREEILAQLNEMKTGNFSEEELNIGRQALISSLSTMQDSHGRTEDFWVTQQTAGVVRSPDELIHEIEKVTKDQVISVANKLCLDTIYYLTGKEE